jgi:hypothetical protein
LSDESAYFTEALLQVLSFSTFQAFWIVCPLRLEYNLAKGLETQCSLGKFSKLTVQNEVLAWSDAFFILFQGLETSQVFLRLEGELLGRGAGVAAKQG